jgi:bifunctional DNA-binding transcriptional regulator/antitoxin component of YhaV-PrlF toxin-antitoxin module
MRCGLLVSCMSSERVDSESKVSGNQANIPARIRRELDIDDGDKLRWHIEDDGTLRVQVVQQRHGTFDDFDGYNGEEDTDVTTDHDAWGVDVT